ncbi:uncharacterized protein LOC130570467 [Triplophysa rosa]|uniref:Ig-like domain-containing protein n=1 Tax=Triplophysa rosa TaxID=992332 RepID=A0A9W7TCD2_TRIRA|nr:uncharacterized protein LOC130570467 [Triplophysa rosa]KAI7795955.1 hypothetical protein IRJ41_010647 [Triplophysa rosa]
MKRSSKLMCGLLMSWLCFRATGLDEKISVIQSPDNIAVNEGESANITCCWTTMTKEIFNVKVGWFKNETRVSAENRLYQKSPSQNCSTLHITHITPNDAGEYMCKVTQDIPILREYNGSKTHLIITTEQQRTNATTTKGNDRCTVQPNPTNKATSPKTAPHLILYLSLAAVVGLLTICLVFTVCRTRNYCKNTERVVIRQTPHNEGEEHENHEEEELSSGSSRGSLQWYQVPVYWSYFDVQSAQDQ